MFAEKVSYKNFRNIDECEIEFKPGINILIGNNAQGKSNALEGIYLMASGKSFRTPREKDLVKFDSDFFEVSLKMHDETRENELYFKSFGSEGARKRICKKNGVQMKRTELMGVFRAVLFCPEHLSIVKDGPSERRNFLDVALCQLKPVYLKSLQRFNKILSERNALLKQLSEKGGDSSLLDVYSDQLARVSANIMVVREEYITRLDAFVKKFFADLSEITGASDKEIPRLFYKNSIKVTEKITEAEAYSLYLEKLTSNNAAEISAGMSLYGSHKDDIEIFLGEKEARQFASQGQQRSLALSLKLGEGEISMEYTGEYPVFLFDDVLSELDPMRQKFLISKIDRRQVIMTTCVMPEISGNVNLIEVTNGSYKCTFMQETTE